MLLLICVGAAAVAAWAAGGAAPTIDPSVQANSSDRAMLIFFIVLSVGVSFLCSVAEAVLLSVTPSYVLNLNKDGRKIGKVLTEMKANIDKPLAVILTLNTIAHTVGAGGTGAKAAIVFPETYSWFMAGYTAVILFGSEILPKTIGAVHWQKLAGITATILNLIKWPFLPLVWSMEFVTRFISGGKKHSVFNRDEFVAMAEMGEKEGKLDPQESTILKNLLQFQKLNARDIMTPRTVMFALQQDLTLNEAYSEISSRPFSRIPVFGKNTDEITGFVLKTNLLEATSTLQASSDSQETPTLKSLLKPTHVVPETASLPQLLEEMLKGKLHITIVVNEYGGTAGIVTLEDVVETLLGMEIVDEVDTSHDMQALARKQWEKRAEKLNMLVDKSPAQAETPNAEEPNAKEPKADAPETDTPKPDSPES